MDANKTIPHTVVAVCTENWCALWVDGNIIPTATAFELKCDANSIPIFKLEAYIASITLPEDFKLDPISAKSVLACISTRDLIETLNERGYTATRIAEHPIDPAQIDAQGKAYKVRYR
ncbi:MAG: hypothetical protein ACI3X2_08950 [Butyricicoccus porcorum]